MTDIMPDIFCHVTHQIINIIVYLTVLNKEMYEIFVRTGF